jgi:hypothetical protein
MRIVTSIDISTDRPIELDVDFVVSRTIQDIFLFSVLYGASFVMISFMSTDPSTNSVLRVEALNYISSLGLTDQNLKAIALFMVVFFTFREVNEWFDLMVNNPFEKGELAMIRRCVAAGWALSQISPEGWVAVSENAAITPVRLNRWSELAAFVADLEAAPCTPSNL